MKRIGCINWDSAIPDTYFGNYTMATLSNFPDRLPYYTEKTDNTYKFKKRSQDDYDRELLYAIEAGFDFFAHCWYSETEVIDSKNNPGNDYLSPHLYELSIARKLHENSRYRDKIKMCAIITAHEMNAEDYEKLSRLMLEDYYEKTASNRPLVFVFNCMDEIAQFGVNKLLKYTKPLHIEPYFVGLLNSGVINTDNPYIKMYDAFSAYAECSPSDSFSGFVEATLKHNQMRGSYGLPSVPLYSMGWNPSPRIKTAVPWVTYNADANYIPDPTPQELIDGAYTFRTWSEKNEAICNNEYILMYAWNEFEEGGWVCPTLDENGNPDTSRVSAVSKVTKILKNI